MLVQHLRQDAFKSLGDKYCGNLHEAVSLKSPEWQRVKAIKVEKESCHVLFLKYSCDTEPFVPYIGRVDEVERNLLGPATLDHMSSVTQAKKDDLLYMCRELIIPRDHHFFYENLPVENKVDEIEVNSRSVKKGRKRSKK